MEDSIDRLRAVLAEHGYELQTQIGSGSYGCVYTVLSSRYVGLIFVAKVIAFATQFSSLDDIFNRETDILMHLSHPHIVRLFDKFTNGSDYILILEFCQNGTIDHFIRTKKLPVNAIVRMAYQTLQALAHCHAIGIAHRDLKPANILVDAYGRAKLVDFGLSVCVSQQGGPIVAGSLAYMAPELIARTPNPNLFSADIWSLGITFYCLFAGEIPWPRLLKVAELERVVAGGIRQFPDSIRPDIQDLLRTMTKIDSAERPSASELLTHPMFAKLEPGRVFVPLAGPRRLSSPAHFAVQFSRGPGIRVQRVSIASPVVLIGRGNSIGARRHSAGGHIVSMTPFPVKTVLAS
jgi:serine/threonine protein kinase